MRELINKVDALAESWEPNWSVVKVYQLPKSMTLYHTTSDSKPRISTKSNRLIPRSISAKRRQPDYLWGNKAFRFQIPAGVTVAELPSIFSILPDDVAESPINLGKILRQWAHSNGIQIIKIGGVHMVGTEYAILDPELVKNYTVV